MIDILELYEEMQFYYLLGKSKQEISEILKEAILEAHKAALEIANERLDRLVERYPHIRQPVENFRKVLPKIGDMGNMHWQIQLLSEAIEDKVDDKNFLYKIITDIRVCFIYFFHTITKGFGFDWNRLLPYYLSFIENLDKPSLIEPPPSGAEEVAGKVRDAFLSKAGELEKALAKVYYRELTREDVLQRLGNFKMQVGEETLSITDIARLLRRNIYEKFGGFKHSFEVDLPLQVDKDTWLLTALSSSLKEKAKDFEKLEDMCKDIASLIFDTQWDRVGSRIWEKVKNHFPDWGIKEARRTLKEWLASYLEEDWREAYSGRSFVGWHILSNVSAYLTKQERIGKGELLEGIVQCVKHWLEWAIKRKRWLRKEVDADLSEEAALAREIVETQTIKNKYLNAIASRVIQEVGTWSPETVNRTVPLRFTLSIAPEDYITLGFLSVDDQSCYGRGVWRGKISHFTHYPENVVCLIYSPAEGALVGRAIVELKKLQSGKISAKIDVEHLFLDPDFSAKHLYILSSDDKKAFAKKLEAVISQEVTRLWKTS